MSESTPEVPVDKLAAVFIKIRDKKSQIKKAFDAEYSKLTAQQDLIKSSLLERCKADNVNSFNTEGGTVIRSVKATYWTSDWDSMNTFIVENNVPEFFTKSLNQSNVKSFLEEHPDVFPPGLNVSSEYTITIRKPTKRA